MNVKVSIVIPVYNTAEYLRECLDSAMNQTLREIEIICVDDGSTDGSGAICDEYAARDSRFVVIHQKNGGQSTARNAGLDILRGEYFALLDSDDWIKPEYCQLMLGKAVADDADFVSCFSSLKSGWKMYLRSWLYSNVQKNPTLTEKVKRAYCAGTGSWRLWKTAIIRQNKLRFHEGIFFEDVPFVIESLAYANRVAVVFKPIYIYRQRSNSIVHTHKNVLKSVEMFDILYKDLSLRDCFDDFAPYYYNMKWRSMRSTFHRLEKAPSEWQTELFFNLRDKETELEKTGDLLKKNWLSWGAACCFRNYYLKAKSNGVQ